MNGAFLPQEMRWIKHKLCLVCLGARDPRPYFPGKLSCREGLALVRLARAVPAGGAIVEIGCYGGLSTAYLLEGARRTGARVYSIDPFDSDTGRQQRDSTNAPLLENKPSRGDVDRRLRGFGHANFELIQGFSHAVVRSWGRPIDLLWIDGNHEYAAVKQDFDQWSPFLKVGGRIAFHDANKLDDTPGWTRHGWEGPTRLVREALVPPRWVRIGRTDGITHAAKAG